MLGIKLHLRPGSSVGIATDYELEVPGSNPGKDEISRPVETCPGAHPASCKMDTGPFPEVKCGRGVLLTTHLLLETLSCKCRAIPLPTLWTTPGLQREHFTFLYIKLHNHKDRFKMRSGFGVQHLNFCLVI